MKNYLEFEKEIKSLEEDLDSLKSPFGSGGLSEVDTEKIKNLQNSLRLSNQVICLPFFFDLDEKMIKIYDLRWKNMLKIIGMI